VSKFRWLRVAGLITVCWIVTGAEVGWAEPAQIDWIEDPYAPHITNGTTARLGTAVGFLYNEEVQAMGIGASAAVGQRWGRLAVESELDVLSLRTSDAANKSLGNAERLNVLARVDVIRVGPEHVGANSLFSVYVEGGAGVAWNHWSRPSYDDPTRVIPDDTKRVEGQAGFGIALDHRLQEPIGFPRRIGWFLGWRLAFEHEPAAPGATCRGCQSADSTVAPVMTTGSRVILRAMLFQSSLNMTW
jgi:hypothetical protein